MKQYKKIVGFVRRLHLGPPALALCFVLVATELLRQTTELEVSHVLTLGLSAQVLLLHVGFGIHEIREEKKTSRRRIIVEADDALVTAQQAMLEELVRLETSQLGEVLHAERSVDPHGRPTVVLDLVCDPGTRVGYSPDGEVVYRDELDTPYETAILYGPFDPEYETLLDQLTSALARSEEGATMTVSLSREYHKTPEGLKARALSISAPEWSVSQRYS